MTKQHWVLNHLGTPWSLPDNDCWGLVRKVYQQELNISLPPIAVDDRDLRKIISAMEAHPEHERWERISFDDLQDKDVFVLGRGSRITHIGLYADVDGGGVAHSIEPTPNHNGLSGVVFQDVESLTLSGWKIFGCYRYKG
jgi:cell wall-associated NlpC family hydrolase